MIEVGSHTVLVFVKMQFLGQWSRFSGAQQIAYNVDLPFASRARPAIRSDVEADRPRTVSAIRPLRKSVKRWGIWSPAIPVP